MGSVLGDVAAILIAAGIIAVLAAGAAVAGVLWLRRAWRRRRVVLARKLNQVALGAIATGVQWLRTRLVPDHRWWTLQRARRGLLRSTADAEHAVREARAADAPLGDLEGLTRRLRRAAIDVDRSLRVAQRSEGTGNDEVLRRARELATTAARIQRAAAYSLACAHGHATEELSQHVRLEEQAIVGGFAG